MEHRRDEHELRQLPFTAWELAKGVLLFGGFLAVLLQVGRWWGEADMQLRTVEQLRHTLTEVIVPKVMDQEQRLDQLERQMISFQLRERLANEAQPRADKP